MRPPVTPRVLILHQQPPADSEWLESDRGVLDEVAAVRAALEPAGLHCRVMGVTTLPDIPPAVASGQEPVVINLVETLFDDPMHAALVPAVVESLDRGCTGNATGGMLIGQDKNLTKAVLQQAGVRVPQGVCIAPGESLAPDACPPFPVIVKPLMTDASEGITADGVHITDPAAVAATVRRLHRSFGQPVLVEAYIDGREFNVSVIDCFGDIRVLPVAEIDFSAFPDGKTRIVDYAAKWHADSFEYNHTPRRIPADVTDTEVAAIEHAARQAWTATGCRDYARVDMRMDAAGRVFVIEVNPNPDISPDAGFAAALQAAGIAYGEFVQQLVSQAASRRIQPVPSDTASWDGDITVSTTAPDDRDGILAMLAETKVFRPDELSIAAEVLDDAISGADNGHYHASTARAGNRPVGWVCHGQTPCCVGTFDIYWLGVDPRLHGRGVGRRLMDRAEDQIRSLNGRLAVVETAGRPEYNGTRAFYERIGYRQAAVIPDFYAPGDSKVVYTKTIPRS